MYPVYNVRINNLRVPSPGGSTYKDRGGRWTIYTFKSVVQQYKGVLEVRANYPLLHVILILTHHTHVGSIKTFV